MGGERDLFNETLRTKQSDIIAEAEGQVEDMEHYVTHSPDSSIEETQAVHYTDYWRCFHCGEVFKADQEAHARRHFGALPPSMPACWYGKKQLIALLRAYEDQNRRLLQTIAELIEENETTGLLEVE